MWREHLSDFSSVAPWGIEGDDESEINIGLAAGSSISKMNKMSAWHILYPSTTVLKSVVVSQKEGRFAAVDVHGATLSDNA